MEENLTKTEAVGRLISLAKEVEIKDPIDWSKMKVTEEQVFEVMAANVIDQLFSIPEDHRTTVAMATMTKLLVENFVLSTKLAEEREKNAISTNSS
jgi:hypothetical protein